MDLFNYSSSPFIPGSDMGNMMAFASPETLVANYNDNRKKLIERNKKKRSKKNNEVKVDKPSSNTSVDVDGAIDYYKLFTEGSKYSPSFIDRVMGGFKVGGQAYSNLFQGRPIMTDIDQTLEDIEKGIVRNKDGEIIYQGEVDPVEGNKIVKVENVINDDKKKKDGEEIDYVKMTKYAKDVIDKVDKVARDARGREFLRQGIGTLVTAPAVVGESALRSAEVLNRLAIANMGAMAAQNSVLASNPTKLQIAGKYFRS
jgi:hypothetical protein